MKLQFCMIVCILCRVSSATLLVNRLRTCSRESSSEEIDDSECTRGAWVPDGVDLDCVCVTGTWLLSESFCGPSFYILSGSSDNENELTCFSIPAKVRRLASLSRSADAYAQFLMQADGKSIKEIEHLDASPGTDSPVVIIRLNAKTDMYLLHKEGVESDVWQKCIESPGSGDRYMQIIKSDQAIMYLKSIGDGDDESCDDVRDKSLPYSRTNDTVWIINTDKGAGWSSRDGEILVSGCSCSPPHHHSNVVGQPREDKRAPPQHSQHGDVDYDLFPTDISELFPRLKDPLVHQQRLRDNAQTTASMLTHLKEFLLQGVLPPQVKNPTFDYIRFGRSVLAQMCPEIPTQTLFNFIGLFRILIAEVLERFPDSYANNLDIETHYRITETMKQCVDGLQPVKFFWDNNQTGCATQILSVERNGTALPFENMPEDVEFNREVDKMDLVLEVAWKAIMAAHYGCASYFESQPDDLSFMYIKSHEFLSIPYVLFRWENPASYLTKAYTLLNPGLNAGKLAEQIDACVFTAFNNSPYKIWLSKPHSSSEFLRDKIMEKSMDRMTKPGGKQTVFNNNGYCVHKFEDPLTWTAINEHVGAKCGPIGKSFH